LRAHREPPESIGARLPEHRNHVWSEDRTHDGPKLKAIDVIDVLSDLFILRGVPAHIRSDNGPEFVAGDD
jgi:hypothetical protein